ncbi:M-phase-specific PLK1-interacting protein [Synchiropus picturatus]
MYRTPHRGHRSPGPPRPPGSFPSPGSGWNRSPYGHSPRGAPYYSPGPPGYMYGSPSGGYSERHRDFGGNRRRSGDSWRRPASSHYVQSHSSDSVEKYFSPAMLQDPWEALQDAAAPRHPTPPDSSVNQAADVPAS